MKSRHFKSVPRFLDDDLRTVRLEGVRQLFDVVKAHEKYHFRDLLTGDQTWAHLDVKPRTVWFPADAEPRVRVKRTNASEECMVIIV
jgi:hypothetical protein